MSSTVLVTGGSGFLGLHTIIQLLERGERVRTTVRSPAKEIAVRETLARAGVDAEDRLAFVVADLLSDDGWPDAVAGAERVLHVASPFPAGTPAHEDDLIVPAREGTLRVLRAARDAGARRVVVTSSSAAIGHDREPGDHLFTEADWTDPAADVGAYIRSKTLAERAAWEFVEHEGGGLELAVVNPGAIFGPVLAPDLSASIGLVAGLLNGAMAGGVPRLAFSVVDVRDVADLHLRAMDSAAAAGERFIAASGDAIWLADAARLLRERLGDAAAEVPATEIPDDAIRAAAANDPSLERIAREVGKLRHLSSEKARGVLGWAPRTTEEAIMATAESLLRLDSAV
ncbi:aldehyde reductase [Conexibacter stalactiti]|uniref:Aldehyde reductase n=1 Tax=Conexibacter stalactiti TaxID=1940611 RepID=A0ABU4HIJ7_9ACTN|nr:aldehyde reductase [Conexibacter stalactiti]MDW5593138.1 aldehyde reductase [Conexibacter stalactiti]MEC5033779.1 aldehyde reductase [Conexibacter stalactiti]